MKIKCLYYLLSFLISVHFSLIIVTLLSERIKFPAKIEDMSSIWVNPAFEQDWGMFSNPPTTDDYCLIRFSLQDKSGVQKTGWYDITEPLNERGAFLISIDQRLAKYMSGVTSNIDEVRYDAIQDNMKISNKNERKLAIKRRLLNCSGYRSIILYARIVFSKLTINWPPSKVKVQLKVIHEKFPKYKNRNLDFFSVNNRSLKSILFDSTNLN